MKTEILVRNYSHTYEILVNYLAEEIAKHTSYTVNVINHVNISENDFEYEIDETLVSIDAHIAKRLGIPYYRISRVFDHNGDVLGRYEAGMIRETGTNVRILDSDIVNGDTIRYACERFKTTKYSVPLVVKPHQDLIDIEDIMEDNSIIVPKSSHINEIGVGYLDPVRRQHSYLYSKEMFMKRTSLPEHMYEILVKFKKDFIDAMNSCDFS